MDSLGSCGRGQTTRGATVALVTGAVPGRGEAVEYVIGSDRAFYLHLRAGFRPTSQLAIVYTAFRYGGRKTDGSGFLNCDLLISALRFLHKPVVKLTD